MTHARKKDGVRHEPTPNTFPYLFGNQASHQLDDEAFGHFKRVIVTPDVTMGIY